MIAEGVETVEQLDFLKTIRCDTAQGFLVSPALAPADFEALILRRQRDGQPRDLAARHETDALTGPLA